MDAHSLSAEREGQAIARLYRLIPHNVGANPHAILWNTVARSSHVREAMEQTTFAKRFVASLRKASWFKGQRIVAFLAKYSNPQSSSNRRKGNERRRNKRLGRN